MLKQKFTELFKKNGYYVLAAVCIVALAAAIGIISTTTSDENAAENAAGFTDAQTDAFTDNDDANTGENEVAANSGLDYVEGYDADQIQDIITQLEENQTQNTDSSNTNGADSENTSSADSGTADSGNNTTENTSDAADNTTDTQNAAQTATLASANAFDETQTLSWPLSGSILLDYSMNTTTYFKTLDQYKCNPGLLIAADINTEVHCAYSGTVESISADSEYGQTVTINMGNDFRAVYGQLKDITVSEGDVVPTGSIIGTVAAPTKYYIEEGSHLYFELTKDEIPTDPKVFLQ